MPGKGGEQPGLPTTTARGRQSQKLIFSGTYGVSLKFDPPQLHQFFSRGYGAIRSPARVSGDGRSLAASVAAVKEPAAVMAKLGRVEAGEGDVAKARDGS